MGKEREGWADVARGLKPRPFDTSGITLQYTQKGVHQGQYVLDREK